MNHEPYDLKEVSRQFRPHWDADTCWFLSFAHGPIPVRPEVMKFVRALRSDEEQAIEVATTRVCEMFREVETQLRGRLACRYIVAAPRHDVGGPRGGLERVCRELSEKFTWLTWIPGALQRTASVPASAGAPLRKRPTLEEHLQSIDYRGPQVQEPPNNVILFDDALATGATSEACGTVLLEQAGCERVVRLFIARVLSGPFSSPS